MVRFGSKVCVRKPAWSRGHKLEANMIWNFASKRWKRCRFHGPGAVKSCGRYGQSADTGFRDNHSVGSFQNFQSTHWSVRVERLRRLQSRPRSHRLYHRSRTSWRYMARVWTFGAYEGSLQPWQILHLDNTTGRSKPVYLQPVPA